MIRHLTTIQRIAVALLLVGGLALAQAGDLVIQPPAPTPAGGIMCFSVGAATSPSELGVSIECNGVQMPENQISISGPNESGFLIVCVRIPSGASGATVTITATTATASGSASAIVQ